ncbi:hypothetical protein STEG23_001523 [Scotinomys teguina]
MRTWNGYRELKRDDIQYVNNKINIHETSQKALTIFYKSNVRVLDALKNSYSNDQIDTYQFTARYAERVTFLSSGITFNSVTRKDTGEYTCMVSEDSGQNYAEVSIRLTVFVPPSKLTVNIPSSLTIGNRAVLTCSEQDGSQPSEYSWFKDGIDMLTDAKKTRAFINSSYTVDPKSGDLVFDPVTAFDSGEYY